MTQAPCFHLYIQPVIGTALGGNAMLIGSEAGELRLHVFHSKERARALLERYREGMDAAYVDGLVARVAVAQLPERSAEPDVLISGFMADMTLKAFRANGESGRERVAMIGRAPRVSICFLSPDQQEGLCAWRAPDDWHVAHFFSLADAAVLADELSAGVSAGIGAELKTNLASTAMPFAAPRPMVRFHGHAAALLATTFEMEQMRQAGN